MTAAAAAAPPIRPRLGGVTLACVVAAAVLGALTVSLERAQVDTAQVAIAASREQTAIEIDVSARMKDQSAAALEASAAKYGGPAQQRGLPRLEAQAASLEAQVQAGRRRLDTVGERAQTFRWPRRFWLSAKRDDAAALAGLFAALAIVTGAAGARTAALRLARWPLAAAVLAWAGWACADHFLGYGTL